MLDIKGENVKLWKNEHDGRDGEKWYSYSISISKKNLDGKWVSKPVKMFFPKDITVPNGLKNGAEIDFEGFPALDIYKGKDGQERREIMIVAQKVFFKGYDDNFAEQEEDIPFN